MKNLLDLTQEMLRINSETSKEQEMSDYLRDYCKSLGFDEVVQDENGNVIAIIDAGTEIYKVKHFRCKALSKGSRSGIRVIYAYFPDNPKVTATVRGTF